MLERVKRARAYETRAGYAALDPLCARQPIASIEEAGTKTLAIEGDLTQIRINVATGCWAGGQPSTKLST